MTLPTNTQRDILEQALPMMCNESLLYQFEFWIRAGMGESYWAFQRVRCEILKRMEKK